MRLRYGVLIAVVLVTACSRTSVLNALAPSEGITLTRDITYAPGPRRTLDIHAPRSSAQPAPVVVFFYGGNWDSGVKEMYRFVGAALAARGMLTVILDYRLYPQVRFPAFRAFVPLATGPRPDLRCRTLGLVTPSELLLRMAGLVRLPAVRDQPVWRIRLGLVRPVRAGFYVLAAGPRLRHSAPGTADAALRGATFQAY
jgi:hypothetical protein